MDCLVYRDGDMSTGRTFTYQYCPPAMGRRADIKDDLDPQLIRLLESTTDKSKVEEWKVGRLLRDLNKQSRAYSSVLKMVRLKMLSRNMFPPLLVEAINP